MSRALGPQRQGEQPGALPGRGHTSRDAGRHGGDQGARAGSETRAAAWPAEVWPPGSGEPLQAASAFEGFRNSYGGTPFFKNFLTERLKPAQGLVAKRTEVKEGARSPRLMLTQQVPSPQSLGEIQGRPPSRAV